MEDYELSAKDAARELGMDGRLLRRRLRAERPLGAAKSNARWFLTRSYVDWLKVRAQDPAFSDDVALDVTSASVEDQDEPSLSLGEEDGWSDWVAFDEALATAPRLPGVYEFRVSAQPGRASVYIGMAGERREQGIREIGRLCARSWSYFRTG